MTEPYQAVQRRYRQPLPSRRKHALLALCVLMLLISGIVVATKFLGNAKDADVAGAIAIEPLPLPPASDNLNGIGEALPDLLAGDVPENENPTEKIDALGNPVHPSAQPPVATTTPQVILSPITNGPQTIMIDGAPIDGNSSGLAPAPFAGLSKMSAYGRIPAIGPNGIKSVSAYKRPFIPVSGKKPISIIIGGLGVNRSLTQKAINELPADVTLSFATHATGLQNWVHQARAKGHEVLIELPMESSVFDASEPGADRALLASHNTSSNNRNLDWLLSRAQGYFAVTNYNGDLFLTRADAAAPILDRLAKAGLGFIYDGSETAPSLSALSQSAGLPFAKGFNLIDPVQDSARIKSELIRLADTARASGGQIGVGFAYPETIEAVKNWTRTLDSQGLVLAPASYALR